MSDRIPVTVLTGYLGSGKTTLLNRILSENHGQRIAVIENEFGQVGVDHQLVIQADEEIFEMNNGCICCTVRGDLIRILGRLAQKRHKFDRVLIETTGLADPGPVAQTFFMDADIKAQYQIDGIVSVIDAKHILQQLTHSSEAQEQVAFADRIVINKQDLISSEELEHVRRRVRGMNAFAPIEVCSRAQVPLNFVLNVGGFDLNRALELKPEFLVPEYPFEWVGELNLEPDMRLRVEPTGEPMAKMLVLPTSAPGEQGFADLEGRAAGMFSEKPQRVYPPKSILLERVQDLQIGDASRDFKLSDVSSGRYLVFMSSCPQERPFQFLKGEAPVSPSWYRHFHSHKHDDEVTSVSLETSKDMHPEKFNQWISGLLREQGAEIFRTKGILKLHSKEKPFVFQAVHMVAEGHFDDRGWVGEPRTQLVMIGRNLRVVELREQFERCVWEA